MRRALPVLVGCAAIAAACGGLPAGSPTAPRSIAHAGRLSRTRFMAFGDSLTTGEITAPISIGSAPISRLVVVPGAAYPAQLQSILIARYANQASSIRVANAGAGGETVIGGALRFAGTLDEELPEAVLILEGVNSLGAIGPDVSATLIRDMVRAAHARRLRVFVASMIPTIGGRLRSQNAAQLEVFNARLLQMTVEEGALFVDLYNGMMREAGTLIGVDGLHPTEAGYRRIAEIFAAAIGSALEE